MSVEKDTAGQKGCLRHDQRKAVCQGNKETETERKPLQMKRQSSVKNDHTFD